MLRHTYPILLWLLLIVSCQAQPSSPYAPESGKYNGYILSLHGTMTYGFNPHTGWGAQPSTTTNLMPSVLGDMTITSKGNNAGTYSFSRSDFKGEWKYDEASNQLTCTGPLKDAVSSYQAGKGQYMMTLTFPSGDGKTVSYTYSKKASKEFPKLTTPNPGITGLITIKPDHRSIAILDAAKGVVKTSFNTGVAATNNAHYSIGLAFTTDPHNYEISIFDPQGQAKVISPEQVRSFGWWFTDYKFAVLGHDNARMALMGSVPDKFADFNYKAGYYAIGVFDMQGKSLGYLPMDPSFIKPVFFKDGRLLYSPDKGGVAISNGNYTGSQSIYTNRVNCFALSHDEQRVALSSGLHFYTMNVDGSGVKQIFCGGKPLEADKAENVNDMAWSPDGKYLVLTLRTIGKSIIVIVPLDGKPYYLLRNEVGDTYTHDGPAISWH